MTRKIMIVPYVDKILMDNIYDTFGTDIILINMGQMIPTLCPQYSLFQAYMNAESKVCNQAYAFLKPFLDGMVMEKEKSTVKFYKEDKLYAYGMIGEEYSRLVWIKVKSEISDEYFELKVNAEGNMHCIKYYYNNQSYPTVVTYYDQAGKPAITFSYRADGSFHKLYLFKALRGGYLAKPEIFFNRITWYRRYFKYILNKKLTSHTEENEIIENEIYFFDEDVSQFQLLNLK